MFVIITQVFKWVESCETYKHNRMFPQEPLSTEEAEFPIAYSMVVYKESAQVSCIKRGYIARTKMGMGVR